MIDMTQEDKELLLKDLCARLPYGVKVQYNGSSIRLIQAIGIEGNEPYFKSKEVAGWLDVGSCKPYLRPMSSMTEEELEAFYNLCFEEEREALKCGEWVTKIYYHDTIYSIDWLNKNMFDYRGLIPKDLALSTDDFNPYKN